ncbi:glycosyltransferase family 39 protein [Paenibacillus sp. GSMTC-2017]|uniref:glycosyltransferase family 39 protein n=1 Tax=Paenibacillus sp. GSMTC-2017 TaxID=2794350 RepID=UPI001E52A072|nr:glycosyltransferase family 39 protein [Paenibacillus sp. GSMTC-2017]
MRNGFPRTLLFMLLLFLLLPGHTSYAADNLLLNGDFEQSADQMPEHWTTEAWVKDEGVTTYGIDSNEVYSGGSAAVIHNIGDNHARFIQTIKVKSNKLYRFSGYLKTENIKASATGAHLYVDGVAVHYPQITGTSGAWTYLDFYGKTSKGQKELVVGFSVGGYGSINTGKAWFDNLAVEEVSEAPEGAEVFSLKGTQVGGEQAENKEQEKVSVLKPMLLAVLFTFLFAIVYSKLFRDREWLASRKSWIPIILFGSFAAALAIRIVFAITNDGYANDIALFMFWSDHVVKEGISNFYHTDIFVDYPPGYIYVLFILGHVKDFLGLTQDSTGMMLLYKLPAIVADLLAAAFIFRIAKQKLNAAMALGLALIWLFNPAVIVDSAAWGQVDSVFTLVLVLAISGIAERRFGKASVWYAIAALIKPQAFIFMPILLLAFIINKKWRAVATSAYYGFGTFIFLSLPFFWGNGSLYGVYSLYKETLSSYPYATLNAFNFYALNNANWKPITDNWLFMSYQSWGNIFILVAVALAVYFAFAGAKRGREDRSFFIALILIAVVFIFVTKMHERYMFPILLLSLFAFIQTMDRRILYLFYGFTITNFINMSYVLSYSKTTSNVPMDGIVILCSIANIGLLLYALYIGYDRFSRGNLLTLEQKSAQEKSEGDDSILSEFKTDNGDISRRKVKLMNRKDWIWMGSITLIYAIVAILGLGSMKGPVTDWQPDANGQSFYVDLGEAKRLERITSFGGVGTGKYKYEFGMTPDNWTNTLEVDNSHTSVFSWKSQKIDQEARYVKLTVTQVGFSMIELAFYEAGSKVPLPIVDVNGDQAGQPRRGTLGALFDEQNEMVYNHNYMKGSYFDEIYHARTAYEHIEGIVAYENTHPPLGKLIIALGIKLFGLNPFGWRIAGTIIGIAMVPIIYLMARRIFNKTVYAALAAGLLAVDFMHFTQTRISTIDVYGVFFIMLMFYFMNKYASMNFYRHKLAATFVPLGLAGLFFGLGVASKWIVFYGGAGLAVMLALSLISRYQEYVAAKRVLKREKTSHKMFDEETLRRIVAVFPKYTVMTIAICLVFYIVIPAGIYALSYIPVLSAMKSGYTLKALVDYQVHMFSYHNNLVSSHPFSSSWWEWPFMKRPLWYYSGSELASGMKSTIVAMGNPIIWWTGIVSMLLTIPISIKRKDKGVYMLWIAFLAQYVPWMLVARETFIYHYFAMVPFIILSTVYLIKVIEEKRPAFSKVRNLFIVVAVGLFIMFYPALSGMTVPQNYVDVFLRWFPSWLF